MLLRSGAAAIVLAAVSTSYGANLRLQLVPGSECVQPGELVSFQWRFP